MIVSDERIWAISRSVSPPKKRLPGVSVYEPKKPM